MSEYTFQEAMVRFLAEEEVRKSVYSNDVALQLKLGLSPEHVDRLSQIDPERAEFFADTIEFKNLYNLTRQIPFTCKILGSEKIQAYGQEFHSVESIRNTDKLKHSLAFAEYLRSIINSGDFPSFTGTVLEYEINKIKFLIKQTELSDFDEENPTSDEILRQFTTPGDWLKMIPISSFNHHIFHLESNIFDILKKLSADETPLPPANKQSVDVLLYSKDKGIVKDIIVNSPTIKFIEFCNGKRDLAAIIKKFVGFDTYENADFLSKAARECIELCKGLINLGVIKPLPADNSSQNKSL